MSVDRAVKKDTDRRVAVTAEGLFLLNLLFPMVPLIFLAILYHRHIATAGALARNHLRQAVIAALASTLFFALANLIILTNGGYRSVTALIAFEVYFILVVPLFVLPGLFGLLKAMNSQEYRFPLLGRMLRSGT